MLGFKLVETPMDLNLKLAIYEGELLRTLVGTGGWSENELSHCDSSRHFIC